MSRSLFLEENGDHGDDHGHPIHEGWLLKKSRYTKSLRKRWVVLHHNEHIATYKSKQIYRNATEEIPLEDIYQVVTVAKTAQINKFKFTVRTEHRLYTFYVETEQERKMWVNIIKKHIEEDEEKQNDLHMNTTHHSHIAGYDVMALDSNRDINAMTKQFGKRNDKNTNFNRFNRNVVNNNNNLSNANNNLLTDDNDMYEEMELDITLKNVPKLFRHDGLMPPNPFVIIRMQNERMRNQWDIIGHTEVIKHAYDADFARFIVVKYFFEQIQNIKLDIYDIQHHEHHVHNVHDMSQHDYIGNCTFSLSELVTARNHKLVKDVLTNSQSKFKNNSIGSTAIIHGHEMKDIYDDIDIEFEAINLPKMRYWPGSIDSYLQIYRNNGEDDWVSVYKTEFIDNDLSPIWMRFNLEVVRLCDGEKNKPILLKIWDYHHHSPPQPVCQCITTLDNILNQNEFNLKAAKDATGNITISKGCKLKIRYMNYIEKFSFMSFLRCGLEINLMVAIDFTGSNGDPSDGKSLHYMGPPNNESQYMKVIKSVGSVLEPYSSNKSIVAWGFGANLSKHGHGKNVSHCFNICLNNDINESVNGINGLASKYVECLKKVQLYGPTYFSEVIGTAAIQSMNICDGMNKYKYNILLIITDGVINDQQQTINAIVDATNLPLSIIIIGVGDADFDNMDILDCSDDEPLKNNISGEYMKRDIVHFVPFNQFRNEHISILARNVLQKIPSQVTGFMSMNNFKPKNKQNANNNNGPQLQLQDNDEGNNINGFEGNKITIPQQQALDPSAIGINNNNNNNNNNNIPGYNPYYGGSSQNTNNGWQ